MVEFQRAKGDQRRWRKRSLKAEKNREHEPSPALHSLAFANRYDVQPIPKHKIPEKSVEPRSAYQLVHDELSLEFTPLRNMATFLSTWGEPEAVKLMKECFGKNLADRDQYQSLRNIEFRCIDMLNDLFNANPEDHPTGVSTVGSSEALMLGALVMKKRWQRARKQKGLPTDHPNIVMGAHVHVSWLKFATYFDVEARTVPLKRDQLWLDAEAVKSKCDENTIGVACILGNTYSGHYDDISGINDLLQKLHQEKGWDIPIHVDAAAGGFVAPFLYPDFEWDFRLPRVISINVSSHKYGMVFPGAGFVLFRDKSVVPSDLVFHLSYLGGNEPTFSFNFSRSSSQVVMQYYNLIRLGREGYTTIIENCDKNARYLMQRILDLKYKDMSPFFEPVSVAQNDEMTIPIVAVKLPDGFKEFTVFDLQHMMKARGWACPAYQLCEGADDVSILKFVIKEAHSQDLMDILADDLADALKTVKDSAIGKESDRKASHMVV